MTAGYSSVARKITVSWYNPTDSDFAVLTLSWKKEGENTTEVPLEKDKTGDEFSSINTDESTYTITVIAKDDVGNAGTPMQVTVKATATAEITKIELSRKHLAYNDADCTITATLSGSNFNLIASQSDRTVKAGVYDENDDLQSGFVTVTSIDMGHNQASINLTAPSITSDAAGFTGKRYTVKVVLCGTESPITESFVIIKEALLTVNSELSVKVIPSTEVTADTKTKITITGANLAVAGGIKVRLYNSNGDAEGEEIPIDASSQAAGAVSSFKADIPIPQKEGVFTATVFFGSTVQTKVYENPSSNYYNHIINPTIQVYGTPKFTSFDIPKAGIAKEGVTLIAKVKGTNFKAPGVESNNFRVSCPEKPSITSVTSDAAVTILSDSELSVKLKIPGQAGDYTVKIEYGGQNVTGTFTVKNYGDYSEYVAGKIVLKDGSLSTKEDYTAIDTSNPPVAVLVGAQNGYGAAIGIALHISEQELKWAKDGSTGYKTKFEGIICTPSTSGSGAAQTATFTGDTDGSDNWAYIKQQDPIGTADAETNYPAFYWVNTYNTTYAAQLAHKVFDWYMPSLVELCEVYKNKEAINEILAKISSLNSDYADASLGTSYYWLSSQYSYFNDDAWQVYFNDGYVFTYYKNSSTRVCCLAGFYTRLKAALQI